MSKADVLKRAKDAASVRVKARAKQLQGIAKELHRNAPRGGDNENAFGERRSAPGEPPAMEFGGLFARLDQGLERASDDRYRVPVNYPFLEFGAIRNGKRVIAPRPLGRQALAQLKEEVDG